MIVIKARNVHSALRQGLMLLRDHGIEEQSRNGPVLRAPEPVCTVYENPRERVLLWPLRDANPFFHFYESLWMLAGRRDVAPLTKYVKRMSEYSDDGKTFNAAYGYRWRECKHGDQLYTIIENLARNPNCRRQVLQIWKAGADLQRQYYKRDIACNLVATFQARPIKKHVLDMTVFCRSNDMVWGAYGANAVHFSMLHEYVADFTAMSVGTYRQVSVNFHAYRKTVDPLIEAVDDMPANPYQLVRSLPIVTGDTELGEWDRDVHDFVTPDGRTPEYLLYHDSWFNRVAMPIVQAHDAYKDGDADKALAIINRCEAQDWRVACREWLERRAK